MVLNEEKVFFTCHVTAAWCALQGRDDTGSSWFVGSVNQSLPKLPGLQKPYTYFLKVQFISSNGKVEKDNYIDSESVTVQQRKNSTHRTKTSFAFNPRRARIYRIYRSICSNFQGMFLLAKHKLRNCVKDDF